MSAFNTLSSEIHCPICHKSATGLIQFKYGDTWQFQYQMGDFIRWGGNDVGKPGSTKVKVYGVLESHDCPFCRELNTLDEFDIYIETNRIVSVDPIHSVKDYSFGDGNYRVCVE